MSDNSLMDQMRDKLIAVTDLDNPYSHNDFLLEFNKKNVDNVINRINFNFINKSNNPDPEYATIGASAFDLRANIESSVVLGAGESVMIPTGLYFQLPTNFEIQIRPRSGLAFKHNITVLNSPGTIDADYRGEIGVILINHGKRDFVIENGERIAQAVIATVMGKTIVNLNRVESIDNNTERGDSGFGSTGIK